LPVLALTSGFLSYLSVSLPHLAGGRLGMSDDVLFFLPGVLFGVFILAPLVQSASHKALRRTALVLFSIAAWYLAVSSGFQVLSLSRHPPVAAVGLSGGVGVLCLALASRFLVPVRITLSSLLSACLAGFLGGCLIGLAVHQPRASLAGEGLYLVGFVFWHVTVALCLFRKRTTADERT
jgi:hypothetical protein